MSICVTDNENVLEKAQIVAWVCASSVYVFRGNNWFLCCAPQGLSHISKPTHTHKHAHTHSKACCSINETWIRHEERPPSYMLTQGLPLPSCFLSADYPAFTGLWLSGARKRFSPLSRSGHTHMLMGAHDVHTHTHTHTYCNKTSDSICFIVVDMVLEDLNTFTPLS